MYSFMLKVQVPGHKTKIFQSKNCQPIKEKFVKVSDFEGPNITASCKRNYGLSYKSKHHNRKTNKIELSIPLSN